MASFNVANYAELIAALTSGESEIIIDLTANIVLTSTVEVGDNVTINGDGYTIDASGVAGYGLLVDGDNVTLDDFSFVGGSSYGIKVQPDTGDANDTVSNFHISNVDISGSGITGLDLNGVDGATIENVSSHDNGGNGITLTNSANVELSGLTTSGNAWGGVGIYGNGGYYNLASSSINFTGTNTHSEPVAVYGSAITPDAVTFDGVSGFLVSANGPFAGQSAVYATAEEAMAAALTASAYPGVTSVGIDGAGFAGAERFVNAGGSIQAAINAASAGDTIIVGPGTYTENLVINKSITLIAAEGPESTTIQGSFGSVNATIFVNANINNVTIGDANGHGFHIIGFDSTNPAVETPTVYLAGAADQFKLIGNTVTAAGEAALVSAWNAAVTNALIDGNTFDGKTFVGAAPVPYVDPDTQFTVANAARQLIAFGQGSDPATNLGNNITFTNNYVSGTAGAGALGDNLMTLDAKNSTVSGNTFDGVTVPGRLELRTRGENIDITNNTIDHTVNGGQGSGIQVTNNTLGTFSGNTLVGGEGDELLSGSPGSDSIDGNGGIDTVVYAGSSTAYTVQVDGTTITVTDSNGVVDTLTDVEKVEFSNRTLDTGAPIKVYDAEGNLVATYAANALQTAVNEAPTDATIALAAGTYSGNVTLNKDGLTLVGAGSGTIIEGNLRSANSIPVLDSVYDWAKTHGSATGTNGLIVAADDVTIKGLSITNVYAGVELGNGVDGLTVEDVEVSSFWVGVRKGTTATVSDLTLTDVTFTDGTQGIYLAKANSTAGTVDQVLFDGLVFTDITHKGIYAEALSNAHLTNIEMTNVGQYGTNTGANGNGIDINLKYGTYSNIEIDNFTLNDVGSSNGAGPSHANAAAITVKARDDGSYSGNPASYTGVLSIHDGTVDGTSTGIRVGEPGTNNLSPQVQLSNVTITDESVSQVDNQSQAVLKIVGTSGADALEYSNPAGSDGPIVYEGGADNDSITGNSVNDISAYAGPAADYSVKFTAGHWTVTDNNATGLDEGTDTLTGIDKVQFSDATLDLNAPIKVYDADDNLVATYAATELRNALENSTDGQRVEIANGTYALTGGRIDIDSKITVVGESEAGVQIDATAVTNAWAILVESSDVSLSGFTLFRTVSGDDNSPERGLKIQPDPTLVSGAHTVENITLSDITVSGFHRAEIDINGVINSSLTNVTVDGKGTGGAGIAITDSAGIQLANIETIDNGWGGVGIYSMSTGWSQPTGDITFSGTFVSNDQQPILFQGASTAPAITGVALPEGYDFAVYNDGYRADGNQFLVFFKTMAEAEEYALQIHTATDSTGVPTVAFNNTRSVIIVDDSPGDNIFTPGDIYVVDGMSIQAAIDKANPGDTIHVAAGTYVEDLIINKSVTILGAKAGEHGTDGTRDAAGGVGEATIIGNSKITATGAVELDGLRFLNDGTTTGGGPSNPTLQITTGANHVVTNSIFWSSVNGGANGVDDRAISFPTIGSGSVTISDNYISGAFASGYSGASWGRGIWFDGAGVGVIISGNTIEYARTGLNLDMTGTSTAAIDGNTFVVNGTAVSVGVDKDGLTFSANHFVNVGAEFNLRALPGFDLDLTDAVASSTNSVPAEDFVVVYGGSGNDHIIGTNLNDILDDNAAGSSFETDTTADNDILDGRGGNDILVAEAGNDTLIGGAGNDTLVGGAGTDTAVFADALTASDFLYDAGTDTWTVTTATEGTDTVSGIEHVEHANGSISLLAGSGAIDGTDDADIIFGGTGSDTIYAKDGDDAVFAGGGNDTIIGGSGGGNDYYDGGTEDDTVTYTSATTGITVDLRALDRSGATALADEIEAVLIANGFAASTPVGYAIGSEIGTDVLVNIENATGGSGNDTFISASGNNTFDGGLGTDTADYSHTTTGVDFYRASATSITASGSEVGDDTLDNIERIIGGSGEDNYTGGAADDWFKGGAGGDTFSGLGGIDTFVVDGNALSHQGQATRNSASTVTFFDGTGIDTLLNVERVQFDDVTITISSGNALLYTVTDTDVVDEDATVSRTAATGVLSNDINLNEGTGFGKDQKVVTGVAFGVTAGSLGSALSGAYGSLTLNADGSYTYVVDQALADTIALGETVQETFTYTAGDGGPTFTETLTFTINGTNDAPVVTVDEAGSMTEDISVTGGMLTTNGGLSVVDLDATDIVTTTQELLSATWSGGTLTEAQETAFGNGFSIDGDSWDYAIANSAVQFLAADETITLTYQITAEDDSGAANGTHSQTVTVTITGTNDAPVLGFQQGFEAGTAGIVTGGGYGGIATHTEWNGVTAEDGGTFAVLTQTGSGPYSRLGDHRAEFTDGLEAGVKVYLDPDMQVGEGFSYSVAVMDYAEPTSFFLRDYIFHVARDADGLKVSASNNTNFDPQVASNPSTISEAGWYTLQHVFNDVGGVLSVDLNVIDSTGAVIATWTLSNPADTLDHVNGIRYGWFTNIDVTDGIAVDTVTLGDFSGRVAELAGTDNPNMHTVDGVIPFTDIDQTDSHTLEFDAQPPGYLGTFDAQITAPADGAMGVVAWTFTVPDDDLDFLAEGQTLVQTYTVTLDDGNDGTVEQTVTVTITGSNDVPVIVAEAAGTLVDTGVTDTFADVTGQLDATDADTGAVLSYALAAGEDGLSPYGTLTVNSDGSYTFVPDAAAINALAVGDDQTVEFQVSVSDGIAPPQVTTLTIAITAANDVPVIVAEAAGTLVDTGVTDTFADVTGQLDATDADTGAVLSYALAAGEDGLSPYGTLTVNSDGSYTFVPDAAAINALAVGDDQTVEFQVSVSDGIAPPQVTTLTIAITAANDVPVIVAEAAGTLVDTGVTDTFADVTGQLDATDADTGAVLSYALAAGEDGLSPYGTLTVNSDGSYTFVPDAAAINALAVGDDQTVEFQVSVSDGIAPPQVTTLTIAITAANDVPVIVAEAAGTLVDTGVTDTFADVTGQLDATDADTGAVLSYALAAGEDGLSPYGTLTVNSDGSYTFVPDAAAINALAVGDDQTVEFQVSVSDGIAPPQATTLTIAITAANDVPVIVAEAAGTLVDTGVTDTFADVTGQLDATDADTGAVLSYALAAGEDGLSPYGTLTVNSDGSYTFVPDAAAINALAVGDDQTVEFQVSVSDGIAPPQMTTLTIAITAANDVPVIVAEAAGTLVDTGVTDTFADVTGQLDATDADTGAVLSYALAAGEDGLSPYGTLTVNSDGSYTFVPDAAAINALAVGDDQTVEFQVSVSDGIAPPQVTTLTIAITAANDVPVIVAEAAGTLVDTGVTDTFADVTGQLDATDADTGAVLSYALAVGEDGLSPYGTLTVNSDGSYTFVPDAAAINALAVGDDQTVEFQVSVSDGIAPPQVTTLTIAITAANDVPVIVAEAAGTLVDTGVTDTFADVTGQLDATDADTGAVLSYALAAGEDGLSPYGTLTVNSDGSYTFVPDAAAINALAVGDDQTVEFQVSVSDGIAPPQVTTLTIAITAANDVPVIVAEAAGTLVDTGVTDTFADVTGQLDATDADTGAVLSYALAAGEDGLSPYGTLTVNSDGSYTFVPDAAAINALAVGDDQTVEFQVSVSDGIAPPQMTTLTIAITAANDVPVIVAEAAGTLVDTGVTDTFADVTGQLDATDADTGAVLSYALAAGEDGLSPYGTLTVNSDGSYTFVPDAAAINALAVGDDQTVEFQVSVSDGIAPPQVTTLTIAITAANDVPVIVAEAAGTLVDTGVTDTFADVTGQLDATDADTGAVLSYALAAGEDGLSPYGTLTVNSDGSYTFVPDAAAINALAVGDDQTVEFQVSVSDGIAPPQVTTLTIAITAANDVPVIVAEAAGTLVDTGVTDTFADVTGQLDATDADTGAVLSYALAAGEDGLSPYGTLTVNSDGSYTFVPDAAAINALAVGDDQTVEFQVSVSDGIAPPQVTTLTIAITAANDVPVIVAEAAGTLVDTGVTDTFADVTGQLDATDADTGAVLSYALAAGEDGLSPYGTLTVNSDGSYTFVPDAAAINALAVGDDQTVEFQVSVSDGIAPPQVTTLTIAITAANDVPVIVAEAAGTLVDTGVTDTFADVTGQLDATDADTGAVLSYALAAGEDGLSPYGTLTVNSDGSYTFVPDAAAINALAVGDDQTVEFQVSVSDGIAPPQVTTLTIAITAANDVPVIVAEAAGTLVDTGVTDTFADVTGQLDATDADTGAVLSYALAAGEDGLSPYGTLTVNSDGSYTFVPDAAAINALAVGDDQTVEFQVSVSDGIAPPQVTTLTIAITAANDVPVIVAEAAGTLVDTGVTDTFADVTGQLDATDADTGAVLSYALAAGEDGLSPYGTLTVNSDGSYTFVPDAAAINALAVGDDQTVEFQVSVSDGIAPPQVTTLTIAITAANDAPVAVADVGAASENETKFFDVLDNDTDVDNGDSKTLTSIGTVTVTSANPAINGLVLSPSAFTIVGNQLQFLPGTAFDALNPSETATVLVEYTMADAEGATSSSTLTLTVNGAAENGTENDDVMSGTNIPDAINGLGGDDIIFGLGGDDTINAGDGDDQVDGGSGNDVIDGGAGDDDLAGGSGDDVFYGEAGDDHYDGGSHINGDEIHFAGERSEYTVTKSGTTYTIVHNVDPLSPGYTGVDTVTKVEKFYFGLESTLYTGDAVLDPPPSPLAPTAADDTLAATLTEDSSIVFALGNVGTNDAGDGPLTYSGWDGLSAVSIVQGTYGTFQFNADGTVLYQLDSELANGLSASDNVQDQASYRVSGPGGTDIGTVSVNITGANDAPVLVADPVTSLAENANGNFAVLANDTDPEGDTLHIASLVALTNANISGLDHFLNATELATLNSYFQISGDGQSILFNPGEGLGASAVQSLFDSLGVGQTATINLTYRVSDGELETTGTLTFDVNGAIETYNGTAGNDSWIAIQGVSERFIGNGGTDQVTYANMATGIYANLQTGATGGSAAGDVLEGISRIFGSRVAGDEIIGSSNTDRIYGFGGDDTLSGGGSGDFIWGGLGNDTINGDSGSDVLYGEQGDDVIDGGLGGDHYYGGAGRDVFVFKNVEAPNTTDQIKDFQDGLDTIEFYRGAMNLSATFSVADITITGNDTNSIDLSWVDLAGTLHKIHIDSSTGDPMNISAGDFSMLA